MILFPLLFITQYFTCQWVYALTNAPYDFQSQGKPSLQTSQGEAPRSLRLLPVRARRRMQGEFPEPTFLRSRGALTAAYRTFWKPVVTEQRRISLSTTSKLILIGWLIWNVGTSLILEDCELLLILLIWS